MAPAQRCFRSVPDCAGFAPGRLFAEGALEAVARVTAAAATLRGPHRQTRILKGVSSSPSCCKTLLPSAIERPALDHARCKRSCGGIPGRGEQGECSADPPQAAPSPGSTRPREGDRIRIRISNPTDPTDRSHTQETQHGSAVNLQKVSKEV